MIELEFQIDVENDYLGKVTNANPINAIAEQVWNSLDADAENIIIEIDENQFGIQNIYITDDGHGFPFSDIKTHFGKLGGSWKALTYKTKTKNRILHGKEGKGRFKALALGRVA